MEKKMPDINISGESGNANFIMAQIEKWLMQIGKHDLFKGYEKKVKSGNYDELLDYSKQFCAKLGITLNFVTNGDEDEDEDEDF